MVGCTGGQLELFSMDRGRLFHLFANNTGISFSYGCSMFDYARASTYFVGWRPGTPIEQLHHLALASTILRRPLFTTVSVVFIHTYSIECCTKPLLGLFLHSHGSSCRKLKLKVKVWCLCTGIATFWRMYSSGQ